MRILWLRVNRNDRVANHLFDAMQNAVSQLATVTFITREYNGHIFNFVKDSVEKRNIPPLLANIDPNQYDLIFTDSIFAFTTENWKRFSNIPTVSLFEDQHNDFTRKYIKDTFDEFGFSHFLVRYRDATDKYNPYLRKRPVYWFPHAVPSNLFYDYKLPKDEEVLQVGRLTRPYPFRLKIYNSLKGQPYYRRIERPEETDIKKWPIGKEYAKLLNRSKISFSTRLNHGYPVLKYFEIPACNCLLMANSVPEMKDLGFIPGENYIELTDESNIRQTVEYYLKRDYERELIAKSGYHLIHSRHTTIKRANEFIKIMDSIIKDA